MCGRYTLTAEPEVIQHTFQLDAVSVDLMPRYNIAPTQIVPVIANESPKELTMMRWGLIPSWAKDAAIGSSLINARAETLAEKPSFRSAYKKRRCLIPADGFYEWAKQGKGAKQPMYIRLNDQSVFAFAGLWEVWKDPNGDWVQSCTIITTEPNDVIKPLHHRMAVILDPSDYEKWLSPEALSPEELAPLLRQIPADKLSVFPVSPLVNNVRNDDPRLIEPLVPPEQLNLM